MKRAFSSSLVLALVCSLAAPAWSLGQTASNPLSIIPADAMGFVCVPNLKKTDTQLQAIIQDLGLGPMMQIQSLLTALREYGPMGDGLDENGAVALVVLNAETPDQLMAKSGLILAATDPQALLESMGPEPVGEGVSRVMLFGNPSFAMPRSKALVIAPSPESAKLLAADGPSIDTKLKAKEKETMADLDVVAWVDAATGMKLFQPMIEEFMSTFSAAAGAEEGSLQALQAEQMTKNIDMLKEGADTLHMGLSMSKTGLGLRFGLTFKPGSELAKLSSITELSRRSLLVGLPQENYILAGGVIMTAQQAAEAIKQYEHYLEAKEIVDTLGKEKANKLAENAKQCYAMMRGGSFSIASLPPGPEGLIGLSIVCKVADASQWKGKIQSLIEDIKNIETENPEIASLLRAVAYETGAGSVGDVTVDHLSFDMSSLEDFDPEDLEMITKVLGKDGLLLRVAAVSDKHVVMAFGGGQDRMNELVSLAKAGKAPLSTDAGIKRVAGRLPEAKAYEYYLAVDRILGLVKNVSEAIGEEPIPITMAEVNAPIAMAGSGDKTYAYADVFFPMELIVAVKDTAMQAMGMMMGGGMQAEEETSTDSEEDWMEDTQDEG